MLLHLLLGLTGGHVVLNAKLAAPYDASTRPSDPLVGAAYGSACPASKPDVVTVQVFVNKLWALTMKGNGYMIDGYLREWWTDPRLAYSGTADGGCTDIVKLSGPCTLPMHPCSGSGALPLWTPDLMFPYATEENIGAPGEPEGSLLFVSPDGGVYRSRRIRLMLSCKFNFGKLPFDKQHCPVTVVSYRYNTSELVVKWREDEPGMVFSASKTGDFYIKKVSTALLWRELVPGNQSHPTACVTLERDSIKLGSHAIAYGVLLTVASYSGFYISPAAAPGRIALAFLCMLLVLNNVNAVYAQLPDISTNNRIWLIDFLFFTSLFNFLALLEYAVVNYGIQLDAQEKKAKEAAAAANKAAAADPEQPAAAGAEQVAVVVPAASPPWREALGSAAHRWALAGKDADKTMRWLFPLGYLAFVIVFAVLHSGFYKEGVDCHKNPYY